MIGTGFANSFVASGAKAKTLDLVYVQWDSEVASSNVLAVAMQQHGYKVNLTPLDNSIMWQSVANGQADASVSAWLPTSARRMESWFP